MSVADAALGAQPLFAPRSVAIFGASDSPASFGERALSNLRRSGFDGELAPINPRRAGQEVLGHRCYGSLEEYGQPVEQALVMLKAADTVPLLEECGEAGVRAATLVAGGFAEAGEEGRRLQEQVTAIAARYGMRLLGPNCLGFCNLDAGVCLSPGSIFESCFPSGGPLAIVSQSGALAADIMAAAEGSGLGTSFWASTGNEVDLGLAEAIEYATAIEPVGALAVYCEEIRDVPRFVAAVRAAREREVDVAVLRSGTTPAGASAIAAHTASLVSGAELYAAVLREAGAASVGSIRELIDFARVACAAPPAGPGLAIVSSSGGNGALAADTAASTGVALAEISAGAAASLQQLVPFASVENPLDVTGITNSDPDVFRRFVETVYGEAGIGALVVIHGSGMLWRERGAIIAGALKRAKQEVDGGALFFVGSTPGEAAELLREAGIPAFEDSVDLVRAIAAVQRARGIGPAPGAGRRQPPAAAGAESATVLREDRGLDLLERELEVPTVERGLVSDLPGAIAAAERVGFPVVLKAIIPGLTHKVAAGAVHLGIGDAAALGERWPAVERLAAERGAEPLALVEAMVAGAREELFVSAFTDPVLGPFLALGQGGGGVEEADEICFCPAPVTPARALELLRELGRPAEIEAGRAAEVAAIASALSRAPGRSLPAANGDGGSTLAQVEVNPLLVTEERCVAVDVVISVAS